MAFTRTTAATFLLHLLLQLQVHHALSSAALPKQPYPDVWLTGFEPNVIDGQPVEPGCKIFTIGETAPTLTTPTAKPAMPTPKLATSTPKPATAPRFVTVTRVPVPNPTAARSVASGGRPPVGPFKPRLVPPGNRPLPARAPPGNLYGSAGAAFPNYVLMPFNWPVPRNSRVPASRWASFLQSGLARRMAAGRMRIDTSSDSSEEYRG